MSPLSKARKFVTGGNAAYVFARFLAIGLSFNLAYSALSSGFVLVMGMPAAAASALAYATCIPFAYLSHRNLVFRTKTPHRTAFPRYVMLQAPLLALGAAFSWLAIDEMKLPEIIGFFSVGLAVAAISFVAQKFWTFAAARDARR